MLFPQLESTPRNIELVLLQNVHSDQDVEVIFLVQVVQNDWFDRNAAQERRMLLIWKMNADTRETSHQISLSS